MCLFVVWSDCGGKEERGEREREKKKGRERQRFQHLHKEIHRTEVSESEHTRIQLFFPL